ncbi:MAG: ORF6N domain-containing protein [Bacteriovorax sp.]|nr:ORF6N domain-containing protein [Bacteriovorax sp.]
MTKIEQDLMAIESMIYVIRGHRVMLDNDLAKLYGTETGALNRQVKRNINRFPSDFLLQLTEIEEENLRCQIGISSSKYGGRRYLPFAFTENGVAMLSSVLNSERAIEINISIMRIFTKLRSFHALESNLATELKDFKENTNKIFKVVFERMDSLEEDISPRLPVNRKKIGLKQN